MAGGTRRGQPVETTVATPQNNDDPTGTIAQEADDEVDLVNTGPKDAEPDGQGNDGKDLLQRLLEREQELRRKVELREVQKRIKMLEMALKSDDESAADDRQTRNESTSSKRRAPVRTNSESDDGDDPSHRRPPTLRAPSLRIKAPPEYRGKNIREHKDFIRACELVFRESPVVYQSDTAKVLMALPYLKGDPADAYDREEQRLGQDCYTWDEFAKFLLDSVANPVNRMFTIGQQHEDAIQGPKQKVMEFLTYLERLEAEMDPYTEAQQQRILLTKLRPELRRLITNHQTVPTSRIELARLASRLEENARTTSGGKSSHGRRDDSDDAAPAKARAFEHRKRDKPSWNRPATSASSSHTPASTVNRTPVADKSTGKSDGGFDKSNLECYNCGKPGHFSRDCRSKKRVNAVQKPAKNERAP